MKDFFLGRQPILDRNQNLVAFELLFRTGRTATTANVTNDTFATADVIINAFCQLGIQNVLGQHRGFINVGADMLMSDMIYLLPNKYVVLEILESTKITADVVQRCIKLKQMGYQLALDDVIEVSKEIEPLLPFVGVVKIDVLALDKTELASIVNKLKRWPVQILAEKVESHQQATHCKEIGFQMFQGYYFTKPEIISGKCVDPSKLKLLKLLKLVMSDVDIEEIVHEFKHQPGLSYNLMNLVNSVASGLSRKINSIKQAIMILGRKQLQIWIQLLIYTANQSGNSMSNALMQTAATRGKLMELIAVADRPHDKNYQERAFMVGILSLLDELMGIEIQQIVEKLGIPDDISQALLTRHGRLGQALKLIEAKEKGEITSIHSILSELDFLSLNELSNIETQAIGWANRLEETAN